MAKQKKTIVLKVTKVAPKRFLIEQRRKFMFFWTFFQKGAPTLGLGKYFSSKYAATTAIQSKAAEKNLRPVILITRQ